MSINIFKKTPKQIYTKQFPVIGEMQCLAKSETDCMIWSKTIPYFKWDNVKLLIADNPKSTEEVDTLVNEYICAIDNEQSILEEIEKDFRYKELKSDGKDPLANTSEVTMELHLFDMENNRHPHIAISYDMNDDTYVWISIEQGEMSAFTAM